jgi:hypothetical protein
MEQRNIICSELLARYEAEGDDFLFTIVTGYETYIHHFEPGDAKAIHGVASHDLSSEEKVLSNSLS